MHNFIESLKRKGPGGVPLYVYAVGTAVILYFGYRWYSNRSPRSSTPSSSAPTDSVDSSGQSFPENFAPDSSLDGGVAPPETTSDTNPPAVDSSGGLRTDTVPMNVSPIDPTTGTAKKARTKKKAHRGATDHKQGNSHTRRRALPRRRSPRHHPPHAKKRIGSQEKAIVIPNKHPHTGSSKVVTTPTGEILRGAGHTGPTIKYKPVTRKKNPPPLHPKKESHQAKPPLRKRRR